MVDISKFESVKEKGELFYQKIGQVYCPYFREKISFNAQGLEHLKFKGRDKPRTIQDQYMRFKLITLAPEVIKASGTLQGVRQMNSFERIRVYGRVDTILKPVGYYEFVAVSGGFRVKIIVKQIDNGEKFFWSIIPSWGIDVRTKDRSLYGEKMSDEM